jgi:Ca-activated chloride channel family protein
MGDFDRKGPAMTTRSGVLACFVLLVAAGSAFAQGLVIPTEPDVPPLALTRHRVRVEIDTQVASTTVEQVFVNNTERQLEAQYVFPVPKGATASRFTMIVNGKEKPGEIVEKGKARQIYNQIVNRAQDPGLLEYVGQDVLRANIFPILPRSTQTITVRFEQILAAQDALLHYVYPVRHGGKRGATVQGEFSVEVALKSPAPILNVYSPSHAVDIARANDREAKVTYVARRATLEKDFHLYWSVSDKEVGLNLVTFRPDPKDPGYFMMLVSPRSRAKVERVVERDIVFVVDTSGSMAGEKIKQARNALKYCIQKLNDGDRFNIVRFSSFVDLWKNELVRADENRKAALAWADTLLAEGGTNIAEALEAGLAFPKDPARPTFVVFMTDGKPTLGPTVDPRQILAKVENARKAGGGDNLRVFTWGVGYDVDTHLLDGMADAAGGVSEYVRPEEDIEVKVSAFYNKASLPVLTNLELKVVGDKVQLANLLPHALPDLYAGGQLVLLGRYTGEGDVALRLTGRVNGQSETFDYEAKFPAAESRHGFIEPLWAKRRIGHLLDTIRRRGETKELVDDVIRLSVEYGIQTPYTSYLILEDGTPVAAAPAREQAGRGRSGGGPADRATGVPPAAAPAPEPALAKKLDEAGRKEPAKPGERRAALDAEEEKQRQEHNDAAKSLAEGFKAKDGKAGVDTAGYLRRLKEADSADDAGRRAAFRKAAGTRFYLYRDMWVDERFQADAAVTTVKFGSDAYFKLIEKRPELVEVLKIGKEVVYVTAPGRALVVAESGDETLTDAQFEELFKAVKK